MIKTNKNTEVYFMVDIESDGPIPGPYSMNSFGIVAVASRSIDGYTYFDLQDETLQHYAELKPISDKFIPEAINVGGFNHAELKLTGEDPTVAMTEVAQWITETTKRLGGTAPVFTAYPLGFDWMFFYWYLVNFSETGSPFGHSRHLDVKTFYAEKAGVSIGSSVKRLMPKHLFSVLPHTHNALDDAVEQGALLQNIFKWDGKS